MVEITKRKPSSALPIVVKQSTQSEGNHEEEYRAHNEKTTLILVSAVLWFSVRSLAGKISLTYSPF